MNIKGQRKHYGHNRSRGIKEGGKIFQNNYTKKRCFNK